MWPASPFVREVLVMLHELDFNKVSKEVQDIVDPFALSFVSTDIDESHFQRCLQRDRQSLCRGWQGTMLTNTPSSLMERDRLETLITTTSHGASPNIVPSTKVCEQKDIHKCSLDKDENGWGCLNLLGLCERWHREGKNFHLFCPAHYFMIDKDAKNELGGLHMA